jgi:hypothetical protein
MNIMNIFNETTELVFQIEQLSAYFNINTNNPAISKRRYL